MFEVRIVTADRNQVRYKRNLEPYSGPELLTQTLDSIFKSDIPNNIVSVHNDNQNYDINIPTISDKHRIALKYATLVGIDVIQNQGGGFAENSFETLKHPVKNKDTEYLIVLEDDVQVSRNILKGCKEWIEKIKNKKGEKIHFGTLFNTFASNDSQLIVDYKDFWGAQGLIISTEIIPSFIQEYDKYPLRTMTDMDYPRIIQNHLNLPIWCCYPSLVQHIGGEHTSWDPPSYASGDRKTSNFSV